MHIRACCWSAVSLAVVFCRLSRRSRRRRRRLIAYDRRRVAVTTAVAPFIAPISMGRGWAALDRAPGQNLPSRTSQPSLPVERPLGPARAISFRIVRSGGSRRRNRAGTPRGLVCELFCSRRSFVLPCTLRGEASPLLRRAPVSHLPRDAQEAPHAREAVRRTRRVGTPHGAGTRRALGRPAVCVWGVVRLSALRARSPSLLHVPADARFLEVDFSVRFLGFPSAAKQTAGFLRWILVDSLAGFSWILLTWRGSLDSYHHHQEASRRRAYGYQNQNNTHNERFRPTKGKRRAALS